MRQHVVDPPERPAPMAEPYRTALLDSPAEAGFDRLIRLAARLLGAPIAFVSLLDEDRQFFKSALGLPEPLATDRSAPRGYGFCRQIVQTGAPFAVDDARDDPLTRRNPAVLELGWIAVLGVPLLTRDGHAIGTLSVVDTLPRLWSARDAELLGDLAAAVVAEVELCRERLDRQRAERRATAAATEHDEPFGNPFDDAGAGIGMLALDGRWLRVNRALAALLGYEPEALVRLTLTDVTHPDDVAVEREAIRLLRAGECPSYQVETRYRHRGGRTIWVLATAAVVQRPDGEPDHLVTVVQDLTERRQIQETGASAPAADMPTSAVTPAVAPPVRPEARRHWDLPSDALVWLADGPAAFGYAAGALGTTAAGWYERIHPADREPVVAGIAEALARGVTNWEGDYRFRCADGTYRSVQDRATVTYDEHGTPAHFEGVMTMLGSPDDYPGAERPHDVWPMEAMGQLAGGIAHDFNNLLTGILSYCDLILQDLRPDDPVRADVEQIRRAGLRAATRTRQLLAFSGRQILQPRVVSLNDVVDRLGTMLRRLLGPARALDTILEPALWPVLADPAQLEQVVINLVANARDAMAEGGRVTITTANVAFQGPARVLVGRGTVGPGEYVRLSVSDTGVGMSRTVQARIFEPFFTTKASGQGAGLGLAAATGIVRQSGGEIGVESAPGEGTTFHVYLPRSREPAPITPSLSPSRSLPRGAETVLLVDDEAEVRTSARRLLERHGYTVLEADHGDEALRIFQANADRIGLVLTDVVMPGMGGRELVDRLRAAHPAAKVLFMSGYTETALVVDDRLRPNTGFLEKPFTVEELVRQVRMVLDGVPPTLPAPPAG